MALTVAIQMDHVSSIDITGDSTFVLALEAQRRGHTGTASPLEAWRKKALAGTPGWAGKIPEAGKRRTGRALAS